MAPSQLPNQILWSNIPCGFKITSESLKVVLDSLKFPLGMSRNVPEWLVEIVSGRAMEQG